MNEQDFTYVCDYVYKEAGICIGPGKEYLVDSRLKQVVRQEKMEDITSLIADLRKAPRSNLGKLVVEALTTNETSFLRDLHPFEAIVDKILPPMMEARQKTRELTIWCAACSSGQEPYSLQIFMRERIPEIAKWKIRIIATDINDEMVERTKNGLYTTLEVNRGLPASLLLKYFDKDNDRWHVKKDLREVMEVHKMNLHDNWTVVPDCDLILMRNVLIYFDVEARQKILGRAHDKLAEDGALFLGASETTLGICDKFFSVRDENARYYKKERRNLSTRGADVASVA